MFGMHFHISLFEIINHCKKNIKMNTNSICSSCIHEKNCTYVNNSKGNIIECEEFEVEPFKKAQALVEEQITDCNNQYSGLCKTCSEHSRCLLHSTDAVIWHCEEFKI